MVSKAAKKKKKKSPNFRKLGSAGEEVFTFFATGVRERPPTNAPVFGGKKR